MSTPVFSEGHSFPSTLSRLARFWKKRVMERPRNLSQVIRALPTLVIHCLLQQRSIVHIIRGGGIGDIVCLFPSIGALKRRHPGSLIVFETQYEFLNLGRRCPGVDLAIEEESLLARLVQILEPALTLRPLLMYERDPPLGERIHLIDDFGRSLGLSLSGSEAPQLTVSFLARRKIQKRIRQENLSGKMLVVIHAGPTWRVREWPLERWAELVSRLKSEIQGIAVVQIGVHRTSGREDRLSSIVPGAENWIGTLEFDQVIELLRITQLFIGIDSGILHLAGTVGTPSVGIFGPVDPNCRLSRKTRALGVTADLPCLGCHHEPDGPRHWRDGCPNDIRCMSEISSDQVFSACEQILR